jgi:Leucine-rich repeat (LRR) protein
VLDLPRPLLNLRTADFSHNAVAELHAGLSEFSRLERLSLEHNRLSALSALGPLPHLRSLNLASNWLRSCGGLEALNSLCELDISTNQVTHHFGAIAMLAHGSSLAHRSALLHCTWLCELGASATQIQHCATNCHRASTVVHPQQCTEPLKCRTEAPSSQARCGL